MPRLLFVGPRRAPLRSPALTILGSVFDGSLSKVFLNVQSICDEVSALYQLLRCAVVDCPHDILMTLPSLWPTGSSYVFSTSWAVEVLHTRLRAHVLASRDGARCCVHTHVGCWTSYLLPDIQDHGLSRRSLQHGNGRQGRSQESFRKPRPPKAVQETSWALVTTRLPWFVSIDGLTDRVDTERGQLLRALFNYVHPAFTNAFGKDPETQDGSR